MRWRKSWILVAAFCLVLVFIRALLPTTPRGARPRSLVSPHEIIHLAKARVQAPLKPSSPRPPPPDPGPPSFGSGVHPVAELVRDARRKFDALQAGQSTNLAQAVAKYKARYGLNPPPRFDKWYHFATKRGVQLIDEYDIVMDNLLPFWALKPEVIRARVREALGFGNNGLIALLIRDGKAAKIDGGPEWQKSETLDMIEEFAHLLPDMDLAFNVHDEPRVVVPHDELSRMVAYARDVSMPAANSAQHPRNAFSARAPDLEDASISPRPVKSTRFNEFAHQATWVPSRLSCAPDSPARDYRDRVKDNTAPYALGGGLGFIYNHTAMTDICNTASLRTSFGFFNRPNAFKIAHELIPIFSQSKLSSFQDILYPSPWYHYGKTVTDQPPETHQVQYNESMDMDWEAKNTSFWWRGSTTGGFSRDGGWRNQHRQQFVQRINARDKAKLLANRGTASAPRWEHDLAAREDYRDLVDVYFMMVGQCDPDDCAEQLEAFEMVAGVDPQQAWSHKYLLDIDGNAFSGRFHSFLHSRSLALKMSMFREWHDEWLLPWVHYIPLSLKGDEHLEIVRFLAHEDEGKKVGPGMALQSRDWAGKVLRRVDMEVWLFRLLLEYARVVDDNRETIGFEG